MEKPDPYRPSLPHVVIINGFQVLQSSIICLPYYPIGRRYLPYSSPYPVYVPHSISKWHARPLFHSLYPGYNSGLEYSVQCQFSLELARCSNSISHSNKLYFPLILSHVWKFFSNPHPDHDILHMRLKNIREGRTFWDHKSRNTIKYLFLFFFFAVFNFSC